MKKKVKTIGKIIGGVLLALLLVVICFTLIVFFVNKRITKNEYDVLDREGYANPVLAYDYKLNVCSYGNRNGRHTLVALSGRGVSDYSVTLRKVTDSLAEDNLIVFIDRAGYGLSEDTHKPQTTEQIVEDYRRALKTAGYEAPYVLLPHSLGGVYATYWESKYPDEIEGVVFIDSTELYDSDAVFGDEMEVGMGDYLEAFACKVGFHRFALRKYIYPLPDIYSEEEQRLSDALNCHSLWTWAMLSETKLINQNCKFAYDNIVTNDIPKVYINASSSIRTVEEFEENLEWMNEQLVSMGMEPKHIPEDEYEETVQATIDAYVEFAETYTIPYIEKLGSCEHVLLPGDHYIFEQKPEECADIIMDFLNRIDGTTGDETEENAEEKTDENMEENMNEEVSEGKSETEEIKIYEGNTYKFYKASYDMLPEYRYNINSVYDIDVYYDASYQSLFIGQVLTLFGEPEYTTSDLEDLLAYAVAAEDKNGNVIYLEVYFGPSGPAIGGSDGDDYALAASELAEIIRKAEPTDYEIESTYEDFGVTIRMGVKNGRPYYEW